MNDWSKFKLDQFADVLDHLRIPINEEDRAKNPGTIPYYGANGLQGYINGWLFDQPLILIAEDGGYFDEYSTRPVAYKISGKSWVNNHAHILSPKRHFDFDYVFYSLQHKNITPFIKGGTRAKLNQKELREIEIYAPKDRQKQQSISKILSTIDRTIAKTEALIEKYQQIKAGLMHDLFTRGIGADGKLRPTREVAPELYKNSAIGWIPKEWEISRLDKACNSITDCPHSTPNYVTEGILVARTMHVKDGIFLEELASRVSEDEYIERISRATPQPGDVIFTREAPVGEAFVIPRGIKICLGQRVMLIKTLSSKLNSNYLVAQIYSGNLRLRITDLTAGTTNPHLNVADVRNLLIALPTYAEQNKMTKQIMVLNRKIYKEKNSLRKLQLEKSGLMHDLLTGKVSVNVDLAP